jgi:hypothetical protein
LDPLVARIPDEIRVGLDQPPRGECVQRLIQHPAAPLIVDVDACLRLEVLI